MARWVGQWEQVRDGLWPICSMGENQNPNFLFLVHKSMKKSKFAGSARAMRVAGCASVFGVTLLASALAHAAPVEIQVWNTLSDNNKAEFEKLVKQYNKEQDQVSVTLRNFSSDAAIEQETKAAVAAKRAPNLIELDDNHSPELVAEHKDILPLYELLAKYPIKDLNWFLPATTSFTRDGKGRLLAFPWMAEMPLMFYNIAAYKKAGLDPNAPASTWMKLQAQLLALRDKGNFDCPYATSDQVTIHLENLAPVNNQLYASNDNGLEEGRVVRTKGKGKSRVSVAGTPALQFDILYMRHISLMTSWKRSLLFMHHTEGTEADNFFAKGECAVLTTGSGAFGKFMNTKSLSFGVAPLPYYDQATSAAGSPFVSGSALWAIDGKPKDQEKATANFLAWLSKPVVATEWHQRTGYLPLTEAAFRASDVSFYDKIPGAQRVLATLRDKRISTSRGFRMPNYDAIEPVLNRELNDALDGKVPTVEALNQASAEARGIAARR
jgi:multiple sugar transport system substrate-binding protein